VFAGGDLRLASSLVLTDAIISSGSVTKPAKATDSAAYIDGGISSRYAPLGVEPLNVAMTLHQADTVPARVHAGGDILFTNNSSLNISKAADISADGDIQSPDIRTIHFRDSDITRVAAGGDIVGASAGVTDRRLGLIQVSGQGQLQVEAGRNLDLVTSGGVETVGNLYNPALSSVSASIRLASGATRAVNLASFQAGYLDKDAAAQQSLVAYVAQALALDAGKLSYAQALSYFGQLTPAHQVAFADGLVRQRFVSTYLAPEANGAGTDTLWAFVAAQSGVGEQDTGSAAYAQYQAGQRALVRFVEGVSGQTGLSFADALKAYRALDNTGKASLIDKRGTLDPVVAAAFLAAGTAPDYAQVWQDRVAAAAAAAKADGTTAPSADDHQSALFNRFRDDVLMAELKRLGTAAGAVADSTDALYGARRTAVRNVLWEATRQASEAAGLGESFASQGDINLAGSKAQTRGTGDMMHSGIDLFSPGGRVLVGYSALSALDRTPAIALNRGLITNGGSIRSFSDGDFQVNAQKVFVIGTGDLTVYSTNGNIDSGRGSNTDVAASDPQLTRLVTGEVVSTTPPPVSGSGIGIVKDIAGNSVGKVNLLAPRGEVRALDAFIQGPEVNVPGPALGADNIKSAAPSGPAPAPVSVNLSVNTGLGSDTAAGSAKAEAVKSREKPRDAASVLTVDVLGVGDAEVPLPPTAAGNKADTKDCTGQNGCPRK